MTTVVKFNATGGTAIAHIEIHQLHERESSAGAQITGKQSICII